LRVAEQIRASNVMVDADLGTAQSGEILLSLVGAGTIEAVGFLMVDALHFKALMQAIPRGGFIGVDDRALGYASLDE
jgi:hypothetical protein